MKLLPSLPKNVKPWKTDWSIMRNYIETISLKIGLAAVAFAVTGISVYGQADKKKKKIAMPFSWVSPASGWKVQNHYQKTFGTLPFKSPSMGIKVGYYVYLPKGYETR